MTAHAEKIPRDLDRVLALPQRPVLDCERERGRRRWAPSAQALVEVMTARYARPRLTCGCRSRVLVASPGGVLAVFQEGASGAAPPPPVYTTVEAFVADAASVRDKEAVRVASAIRSGEKVTLAGLGHPFCLTELNPVQSWILRELPRAGGIFGMISVGGGKTIAGLLAPLALPSRRTWALLAKPNQRIHYKNAYLRLREHFHVPSVVFDTKDFKDSYIIDGTPVLHFIPYSLLSNPKSTTLLELLNPDGVIADESHLLASRNSSRTLRFLRFMAERDVAFCNWSGSTIKKSLKDAAHLAAHALGLGSPYPIIPDEVEAWSAVMDPSPIPDRTSSTAKALRQAFGARKVDEVTFSSGFASDGGIREGHRDRVIQTPGVISTRSSSVTCSISIREREAPKIPAAVQEALKLARLGTRPDGEEIVEAFDIVACAREVAAGYYTYWAYPKAEPDHLVEGGLIDQWFAARKLWNKELRAKIRHGEPYLDSEKLCTNAAERAWRTPRYDGKLPVWPAESWPAWAAIKDLVEPDPRTRWIDDYLARDAAAWAREHRGVVWCQGSAFGRKVAALAGDLHYHAGGPDGEARILAEDGSRSIVASIRAYGESLDGLQYKFSEQLVAELPASGDKWEQLLGREARPGQEAETVDTEIYRHVSENRDAFRQAVVLAEHIEATTPNRQLLLAADIEFDV